MTGLTSRNGNKLSYAAALLTSRSLQGHLNRWLFLGFGVFQAMSCKQMPDIVVSLLHDQQTMVLCPRENIFKSWFRLHNGLF